MNKHKDLDLIVYREFINFVQINYEKDLFAKKLLDTTLLHIKCFTYQSVFLKKTSFFIQIKIYRLIYEHALQEIYF